jgi:hypothetical protein
MRLLVKTKEVSCVQNDPWDLSSWFAHGGVGGNFAWRIDRLFAS